MGAEGAVDWHDLPAAESGVALRFPPQSITDSLATMNESSRAR
jgi:hypothetical protein